MSSVAHSKNMIRKRKFVLRDDSDSDSDDNCAICLMTLEGQIATPENCAHLFCLLCLQEWSQNVNTCPIDRLPFRSISVRNHVGGSIVKKIPVADATLRIEDDDEPVEEPPTYCEECSECDREDVMLLCDQCEGGYHLDCLSPPLLRVPDGAWYCPVCDLIDDDASEAGTADAAEDEEQSGDEEDGEDDDEGDNDVSSGESDSNDDGALCIDDEDDDQSLDSEGDRDFKVMGEADLSKDSLSCATAVGKRPVRSNSPEPVQRKKKPTAVKRKRKKRSVKKRKTRKSTVTKSRSASSLSSLGKKAPAKRKRKVKRRRLRRVVRRPGGARTAANVREMRRRQRHSAEAASAATAGAVRATTTVGGPNWRSTAAPRSPPARPARRPMAPPPKKDDPDVSDAARQRVQVRRSALRRLRLEMWFDDDPAAGDCLPPHLIPDGQSSADGPRTKGASSQPERKPRSTSADLVGDILQNINDVARPEKARLGHGGSVVYSSPPLQSSKHAASNASSPLSMFSFASTASSVSVSPRANPPESLSEKMSLARATSHASFQPASLSSSVSTGLPGAACHAAKHSSSSSRSLAATSACSGGKASSIHRPSSPAGSHSSQSSRTSSQSALARGPTSITVDNDNEESRESVERQRVIAEEVKVVLRDAYNNNAISKIEYKDILRRAVHKVDSSRHKVLKPSVIHDLTREYVSRTIKRRSVQL